MQPPIKITFVYYFPTFRKSTVGLNISLKISIVLLNNVTHLAATENYSLKSPLQSLHL